MLTALLALATLAAATPLPESRLLSRQELTRITWRHGTDRKTLVVCGSGPIIGLQMGDRLSL
jgi:hypothetical protein